jgi:hypothetical protein
MLLYVVLPFAKSINVLPTFRQIIRSNDYVVNATIDIPMMKNRHAPGTQLTSPS